MSVRLRASLAIFICESILWVFHFYRRPPETELANTPHILISILYSSTVYWLFDFTASVSVDGAEFSFRFASLQEIKFYSLSFTNWNHVSVGVCSCPCPCSRESVLVAICSMFRMRHWTLNWMKLNLMKFPLIASYCTPFFVCECVCVCAEAAVGVCCGKMNGTSENVNSCSQWKLAFSTKIRHLKIVWCALVCSLASFCSILFSLDFYFSLVFLLWRWPRTMRPETSVQPAPTRAGESETNVCKYLRCSMHQIACDAQ